MKPHPKLRQAIKWVGAVVTVLLVVVWVGSGKVHLVYRSSVYRWELSDGQITYSETTWMFESPFVKKGWDSHVQSTWLANWRALGTSVVMPKSTDWRVPLWPCWICAAAVTFLARRLDTLARRRAKLNLCPNCNYDRTGLAKDSKCPECGTPSS